VCSNLEGDQETIPSGYHAGPDGTCVLTPPDETDVCSNLPGNQAEVPDGYESDGEGNCAEIKGVHGDRPPTVKGVDAGRPPAVKGTAAAVPTAVDAGLTGAPASDSRLALGELLAGAGLLLLVASTWSGARLRRRGDAQG
jgi:hypothetical protein